MDNYNITLSNIGLSKYYMSKSGQVYECITEKEIFADSRHRFWLMDDNGNKKKYSQKSLYRAAYNAEYCIDLIQNKPAEMWRYISNTNHKYMISNYGRVKSLCRYYAVLL